MDPDLALLIFLGLCLVGAALFLVFVVLSPFVWTVLLVLGIIVFGLKTCTQVISISGPSTCKPRLHPDHLVVLMAFSLNTGLSPGSDIERFAINVSGRITNNSDREITGMKVWCRAEALQGSETESGWISLSLKPGETKTFEGQVTDLLSGIAAPGRVLRVSPKRHFCRVTEFRERE